LLKTQLASFLDRSYPRFFPEEYVKDRVSENVFNRWISLPDFVYNDSTAECNDCPYQPAIKDSDSDIYLGQWRENERQGRGAEVDLTYATQIYEGYWKAGLMDG